MMRHVLRGFLALLLLIGVACSDDGKEEAKDKESTTTTTSTIPTLEADQVDAEASPYCGVWAEIRELGGPEVTGDAEKDADARKEHYGKLVPVAERLVAEAEPEIKKQAEAALAQVREVAETGSDEAFLAEGAAEMQQDLAAYAQEHCTKG